MNRFIVTSFFIVLPDCPLLADNLQQTNQVASMELNTELQQFLDFAGEVLEHAEQSVIVQEDTTELDAEEYIGLGAFIAVCKPLFKYLIF